MRAAYDTGWTMDEFVRWAFGPRHLAYLALDADLARRSAALLEGAPDGEEIRRRLGKLARALEVAAEARFLREEADLASSLARLLEAERFEPWMLERIGSGFAALQRMIRRRLLQMALLLRRDSGPGPLSAAA